MVSQRARLSGQVVGDVDEEEAQKSDYASPYTQQIFTSNAKHLLIVLAYMSWL